MLDIPDPYYWRDPKYPREIFEWNTETHYTYLNGRTRDDLLKYDFSFLFPVPIRVIIPKIAFPWLLERDNWGEMNLGDAWRKKYTEKGSEKMIEECREYWGNSRHIGWEWMYPVGHLTFLSSDFGKFWGKHRDFESIAIHGNLRIFLYTRKHQRIQRMFEKRPKLDFLESYEEEVFDQFPRFLHEYIAKERGRYKYCSPGLIERLDLSKAAGFLPKPLKF